MSKDGVRSELEKWAEEERRSGLHNINTQITNESLEEALKRPVRTIRHNIQHKSDASLSSAATCRLISKGMTDF
ncbi:MAG: hypothetical protein RJA61_31 [Candidatus Parcubacteria bacterium]|jgi:hypothetical protein